MFPMMFDGAAEVTTIAMSGLRKKGEQPTAIWQPFSSGMKKTFEPERWNPEIWNRRNCSDEAVFL